MSRNPSNLPRNVEGATTESCKDGCVPVPAVAGLSSTEVAQRVREGRVNTAPAHPSRTVLQILRANVFTTFNALLGGLLAVILVVAPLQDATFGLILVINAAVGVVQELRAKRTLDRLAILAAPRATVIRDGTPRELDPSKLVVDDLLEVGPGDQVVVDGEVTEARSLEVDESMLTGEADPQPKARGDRLLSGSLVVGGSGRYQAQQVGEEAYAAQLAAQARRFRVLKAEMQRDIDRLLRRVAIALVPAALLLVWGQQRAGLAWRQATQRSVAGVVPMVPEGLVLLVSVALAVAIIRLGRRRCLVKELAAVEVLARVTVVCVDKTGTLTDGQLAVDGLYPLPDADIHPPAQPHQHEVHEQDPHRFPHPPPEPQDNPAEILGALAHADDHPNATLAILAATYPAPADWEVSELIPFTSERKWSAASFGPRGAFVLGAPEMLLDRDSPVLRASQARAADGQRVLLLAVLARADPANTLTADHVHPDAVTPLALVSLRERLRADAADTVGWFLRQGVEVRVLSGDSPVTVGAVALRVGVPGADQPFDASHLPAEDAEGLSRIVQEHTVFGRVTPQQKRDMIAALKRAGHVVGMTGDGVNDVLALKDADLGVAMGSGAPATRAVAQVVLLDGSWSTLPALVAEGQRVIANLERVANLFLTKTVYAILLAVVIGTAGATYPFLPRHFTVVSAVAIGIPGFALAVAPARQPIRGRFLGRVIRFAVPTGAVISISVLIAYVLTRGQPESQRQFVSLLTLMALSLVVLARVARPLTRPRIALVAGLAVLAALPLVLAPVRRFLDLQEAPLHSLLAAALVALAGSVMVMLVSREPASAASAGDARTFPGPQTPSDQRLSPAQDDFEELAHRPAK
jgi:cation-transporting ATPase E